MDAFGLAQLGARERRFDPADALVAAQAHHSPIHTRSHSGLVHPDREAAAYALFLLSLVRRPSSPARGASPAYGLCAYCTWTYAHVCGVQPPPLASRTSWSGGRGRRAAQRGALTPNGGGDKMGRALSESAGGGVPRPRDAGLRGGSHAGVGAEGPHRAGSSAPSGAGRLDPGAPGQHLRQPTPEGRRARHAPLGRPGARCVFTMQSRPSNAFYAQSGGCTPVLNATACGVLQAARAAAAAGRMGTVYAGRNGILGALLEDLIDTGQESEEAIAALRHTPAAAFGSCRFRLAGLDEHREEYERLIAVFRAHDIGYVFYNGGGDSQDTALKVSQMAERLDHPLTCIGIPKTVDNDLAVTDCSPGFGSVAKYVAVSVREVGYDVASMARTSTRVFLLEVMGRHAGWITAAAGLAADRPGDPPHLLLFPEIPFDQERFLARVDETVHQVGYCIVVVSEGLRRADGRFISEVGTHDAFGHSQLGGVAPVLAHLLQERLGHKLHWAVADYLQRAARHVASKTDVEQAYAVGQAAVRLALEGRSAVMPTIVRLSDDPYRWEIGVAPLEAVANVERGMPPEFISADGFGITDACRRYLRPLIAGEDYPPFENGLPRYVQLQNTPVPKRLAEGFQVP